MSYLSAFYYFYLNEPLTINRMEEMLNKIITEYPTISMSLPFDEMVRFSFNENQFFKEDEQRKWGSFFLDDSIRIFITNCEIGGATGFNHFVPHVRKGARQLKIQFDAEFFIHGLVQEDPKLGDRILPLLVHIASHTNPFFGFYCDKTDLELVEDKSYLNNIDLLISLFTRNLAMWGSLYFDAKLVQEIGLESIEQWAIQMTSVNGKGYFLERSGIPLFGSIQEEDDSLFRTKTDFFGDEMLPKIINRLKSEYRL